jgi:hypothetical protein
MEAKLKIIDAICTRHPAYGVDAEFSEYTGGMKDIGQWFVRKMLDVPQDHLQFFLDRIIEQENRIPTPLTEQELADQKIIVKVGDSFTTEYTRKQMEKFTNEKEQKILFGI